jgi:hypothetical protein
LPAVGTLYELHDGEKLPFSMPGSLGPDLGLPYNASSSFPEALSGEGPGSHSTCGERSSGHTCPASAANTTHKQACSERWQPDRQHESDEVPEAPHAWALKCPVCTHSPSRSSEFGTIALSCDAGSACIFSITAVSNDRAAAAFSISSVDTPLNVHFMAMAAKLIYEDPRIVADCLEHR